MGLVVATAIGLILWLILWALGVKAFDAFFLTAVIVLLTSMARVLLPALQGRRSAR